MSRDLLLGFLIAIPLYAIILYLFKDIIVGRFIRRLIENSKAEIYDSPYKAEDFKEAVGKDLLTSYKLLLIIQDEISFLKTTPENDICGKVYDQRLNELSYTIDKTEQLFDEMGNEDYKYVKDNWKNLLKQKDIF